MRKGFSVRSTNGDCEIWGRKAKVLLCRFKTADGREHVSPLLLSGESCSLPYPLTTGLLVNSVLKLVLLGWWGIARHFNYTGDLMLTYAMCATCGVDHLVPWTYALFMTYILIHRVFRDDTRCRAKYGSQWDMYCSRVPWRLIPGVW